MGILHSSSPSGAGMRRLPEQDWAQFSLFRAFAFGAEAALPNNKKGALENAVLLLGIKTQTALQSSLTPQPQEMQ